MFEALKKGLLPKIGRIVDDEPSTNFDTTRHESLSRPELAQLVLSDTVRRNGIPKDWLEVECFEVVLRPGLKQTHLQLVMQRWSDHLLHYSAALQQQFLAGLDHFEPGVDHSVYIVSWRFASACVMPSALIPEGVAWHVSAHR
jgi:hypothetical protein